MIFYQTIFATTSIIFLLVYYYVIGFRISHLVFSNENTQRARLNENFFLGIISNTLFLYLWNLFFPINEVSFILWILICFFIRFNTYSNLNLKDFIPTLSIKFFLPTFLFCLWLGFLSNNSPGPSDLGLYHLQVIKWAESSHIVKGIGNLHSRLGFSCSSWLLTSQFNVIFSTKLFIWTHSAIYLLLGFINFFIIPVFLNEKFNKIENILRVFYIPISIHYCFRFFPGTSSDLPIFFYTAMLSIYYLKFYYYTKNEALYLIFIISALGISNKLTFAILLLGLIPVLLFLIPKRIKISKLLRQIPVWIAIATFLFWSYRNVLMTGYPFFPYGDISFPVEWKMNKLKVDELNNHIVIAARGYTVNSDKATQLNWYLGRFTNQHLRVELLYPLIIGLLGCLYLVLFSKKNLIKVLFLIFPSLPAIIFWMLFPDNRFFSSSFWWFGSMLSLFFVEKITKDIKLQFFHSFIIFLSFSIHIFDRIGSPKTFFPLNIRTDFPQVKLQKVTNIHGFRYYSPIKGDECWGSEFPCTPENKNLLKNINFIKKNNLNSGIKEEAISKHYK